MDLCVLEGLAYFYPTMKERRETSIKPGKAPESEPKAAGKAQPVGLACGPSKQTQLLAKPPDRGAVLGLGPLPSLLMRLKARFSAREGRHRDVPLRVTAQARVILWSQNHLS